MTATTASFATGDIVRGRPVVHNEQQPARHGIVLGLFAGDPSCGYLVWWYGKGAACTKTISVMFARELTHIGTLSDLSERVLARITRGARHWDDAYGVALTAASSYLRKHAERRRAAEEAAHRAAI